MDLDNLVQYPIINGLQKMAVYRTRSMFYIIGTNILQSKFRVLKVDRTVPHDLILTDDKVEYTPTEIRKMILMLNDGNKLGHSAKNSGATRKVSAFGILGFIRFLEGYYMILITKREKVANIGHHSIYKIADTSILCIPHESVRIPHKDEQKLVRTFNSIDLTANFYFSYTYDLSNSLQYNIAMYPDIGNYIEESHNETFMNPNLSKKSSPSKDTLKKDRIACKGKPHWKFIWNHFLLQELISQVHDTWILPVTHGFIHQVSFNTLGKVIHLAILARRSAKYAGTRFLKRGANSEGDVANEVESEQIVYDTSLMSFQRGNYTSFVQIRGSIPAHWSHLGSLPKPPIILDLCDTYARTSGKHFNKLFKRFGSPIIILNLVKQQQKEGKKTKECILNDEYIRIIDQLNLTIPARHHLQHVALDMANIKKSKNEDVMEHLCHAANEAVKKTGIFESKTSSNFLCLNPNTEYMEMEKNRAAWQGNRNFGSERSSEISARWKYQTGILRVNCVDCLDRTNTAMYAVAKCAMGFQLYALGAVENAVVENGSEAQKLLQSLYDEHGNTLAHQYAGSNLVHRIDSYQQTSGWTDQGRDLMESGRRYYKNTYEDQEKQRAINLFLGVESPKRVPLSEIELSKEVSKYVDENLNEIRSNSALWLDRKVLKNLPLPYDQLYKVPSSAFHVTANDPMINLFQDFYRYNEFLSFSTSFQFNMDQCPRPASADQSVFCTPINQRRHYEETMLFSKNSETAQLETNPSNIQNLYNREPQDSDRLKKDSLKGGTVQLPAIRDDFNFETFFKTSESVYGNIFTEVSDESMQIYEKYAKMAAQACVEPKELHTVDFQSTTDAFNLDVPCAKYYKEICEHPVREVSEASMKLYEDYASPDVKLKEPSLPDMAKYYKLSI